MLLKLLVLVAVVVGVWQAFKYVQRLQLRREEKARVAGDPKARSRENAERAPKRAEDLVQCSVCGAYVPSKNPPNCGRPDCPN
mgnify:CR=1 FL=1